MRTEIIVDNLKCHGCANTITNSIQKMDGVSGVKVDVDSSTIEINHNPETNKEIFTQKLAGLGYPEQGTTTVLQTAKSYVSCAVGRMS